MRRREYTFLAYEPPASNTFPLEETSHLAVFYENNANQHVQHPKDRHSVIRTRPTPIGLDGKPYLLLLESLASLVRPIHVALAAVAEN